MIKKLRIGFLTAVLLACFGSSLSLAGVGKYDSFPGGWNMPFSGTACVYQGYNGDDGYGGRFNPTYHTGSDYYAIDLNGHGLVNSGASSGSKVFAPASGYVKYAAWETDKKRVGWNYGNQVIVEAGATGETGAKKNNRYIYRVAHLNNINVRAGWWVNKGDVLGWVGTTGNSTGAHIHFAIHRGGYTEHGLISGDSFPPSWSPGIDGFNGKAGQKIASEFQPPLF